MILPAGCLEARELETRSSRADQASDICASIVNAKDFIEDVLADITTVDFGSVSSAVGRVRRFGKPTPNSIGDAGWIVAGVVVLEEEVTPHAHTEDIYLPCQRCH